MLGGGRSSGFLWNYQCCLGWTWTWNNTFAIASQVLGFPVWATMPDLVSLLLFSLNYFGYSSKRGFKSVVGILTVMWKTSEIYKNALFLSVFFWCSRLASVSFLSPLAFPSPASKHPVIACFDPQLLLTQHAFIHIRRAAVFLSCLWFLSSPVSQGSQNSTRLSLSLKSSFLGNFQVLSTHCF